MKILSKIKNMLSQHHDDDLIDPESPQGLALVAAAEYVLAECSVSNESRKDYLFGVNTAAHRLSRKSGHAVSLPARRSLTEREIIIRKRANADISASDGMGPVLADLVCVLHSLCFRSSDESPTVSLSVKNNNIRLCMLDGHTPKDNGVADFIYVYSNLISGDTGEVLMPLVEEIVATTRTITVDVSLNTGEAAGQLEKETAWVLKPNQIAIFNTAEVDRFETDNADAHKDQAAKVKNLVKRLRAVSPNKNLMTISDDWKNYCTSLDARFPNFGEPIAFIRDQLALSWVGDRVIRIPPILMLGPPGIGKSEFAMTIAEDFGGKLQVIDMASAGTGNVLSGSDAHFNNSQPGAIFNSVVFSDFANPVIMLEELDKAVASAGIGYSSPLAALHQVLEPRQAKIYRDLAVPGLTIDASHVIWIATANVSTSIEASILDRFACFEIDKATPKQMLAIVSNQYDKFINTHPSGNVFDKTMTEDVLNELCNHHPRTARKIINQSAGKAAFNERTHITIDDIKASVIDIKKRNSIGFSANIR